jgi:serine/threonine protein kinase
MKTPRWTAVSQSAFAWERDALDFARVHLPDHEPWHAWSNFEFIDDEGRVNEVDLLVLTAAGLVLVEIKSRPGTVKGDALTWTWMTDGRPFYRDNPLPLAHRKARRLAAVLRRQEALTGRSAPRGAAPWVEPLIFLSDVKQPPAIDPGTAKRVALRGNPGAPDDTGLIGTLLRADDLDFNRRGPFDPAAVRALTRAIEQAGIRVPGRGRRVGDYELTRLLTEGDNWQDFAAKHAATGVARRVRIYPYARAASPEARERLARTAQREFRVLEGVEHQGIQRVLDYREAEQGPALIFEHDPDWLRLDRYLAQRHQVLSLAQRLALVRQLGDAMAFAHGKRLYHRGLAPQNVLVRNADSETPRLQVTNWQVASRGESSSAGLAMTTGTQHVDQYLSDPAKLYRAPEADEVGDRGAAQADVFSIGAIAFHIFAGRPPADGPLDLPARLREGNGLRLSGTVNGVGAWLEEMIRVATSPVVHDRPRDAREFLDYLAEAEKEALPPEPTPPPLADPATAGPDDQLDGDLIVVKRLGRGGSSDALLVKRDDSQDEMVLKVAIDAAHGDRIRAEAEVLRRLHHQNIVKFIAETTVAERPAILIEQAGDKKPWRSGYAAATRSRSISCGGSARTCCRHWNTWSKKVSRIATSSQTISASPKSPARAPTVSCCSTSRSAVHRSRTSRRAHDPISILSSPTADRRAGTCMPNVMPLRLRCTKCWRVRHRYSATVRPIQASPKTKRRSQTSALIRHCATGSIASSSTR